MEPGDHIVMEHIVFMDQFMVARIVKVGPVMWEIEPVRPDGSYDRQVRRKVVGARKVPKDRSNPADIAALAVRLRDIVIQFRKDKRDLQDAMTTEVYSLVSEGLN